MMIEFENKFSTRAAGRQVSKVFAKAALNRRSTGSSASPGNIMWRWVQLIFCVRKKINFQNKFSGRAHFFQIRNFKKP
jgi:hypothetical protein